ncbi:hypothetical protein QAD02_011259 [Eretmocerus hayati]|uniref:Uncharacterized protein n=1 Tax=Eretmocerus hayati TaxID=131215 RepID=A0ACC2NW79_9HYME|nr:hypothetical protein QAD02_011259 [Eretmocerus hayati]
MFNFVSKNLRRSVPKHPENFEASCPNLASLTNARHYSTSSRRYDSRKSSTLPNHHTKPTQNGGLPNGNVNKSKQPKKERREFAFAKNVLQITSRRYGRYKSRCCKLAAATKFQRTATKPTSRSRLSISSPSNFVHLASATRDTLPPPSRTRDFEKNSKDQVMEKEKHYDDVGPPVASKPEISTEPFQDLTESAYDDVGPATTQNEPHEEHCNEEQVYDDVGPLLRPENCDEEPDEDVYDDVGPAVALRPQNTNLGSNECHERVNSIYVGSAAVESNDPNSLSAISTPASGDKESEWEDLDESTLPTDSKTEGNEISASTGNNKKQTQNQHQPMQHWSRRIRRQRSKASRKSSARSTSRGRVVITRAKSESSDDSNYETLETYDESDYFSSSNGNSSNEEDNEDDLTNPNSKKFNDIEQLEGIYSTKITTNDDLQAPTKAVPPPPREASLGHSLGRRMKMLRRTWSITKGSLGRMRRRASETSSDGAGIGGGGGPAAAADLARKYFSFKRHFRSKSQTQPSALSTFYLDKDSSQEPIYANGGWYGQAGLYAHSAPPSDRSNNSTEHNHTDHYSVLAEEPLYQFYAADATRVAFESDSDGYEEVEELTPSSATTDLARPGHRTLWCQTPQVINSGLLQSLSMEERKVQEAKFEILTSEASYLNSLRVLENEFASCPELSQDLLTAAERERLFGSVPEVLVASERFLAELETVWRDDPMLAKLPELLLKHAEKSCNAYVNYCSNQVSIDVTLKELRAKKGPKFLETLSRIETRKACQSLSLHSFLMLPMQRITRLPLLADAVLSKLPSGNEERLCWERVLSSLSSIVGKCNEGARLAERRNQMDALARKLEYSAKVPPISLHERELIRSGPVVQLSSKGDSEYKLTFGKKFHKTPLMLMLLTDYLLVTKLKSNSNEETYSVMETCKRSLVALESAPEDSAFAGRHAMVLTLLENQAGRQVEYVLTCDSDTERERWLDAVKPPKPSCVGETLYESWDCPQVMALYSYAPCQPDELPLQPGDVINVLRKMNDGWLFGEKLLDGEQGWFPGNFTKEVASEHVRARNLRQRHRFLALSGSVLQKKAKQSLSIL